MSVHVHVCYYILYILIIVPRKVFSSIESCHSETPVSNCSIVKFAYE